MDYLFKTNYKIKSINKDYCDNLAPWSILEIFQDVANLHVESKNIGFNDLLKKNALWVLVGLRYEVVGKLDNDIEIITWQAKKGRAEFIRNFIIKDNSNNQIVATSKWCLIDNITRKILPSSVVIEDISGDYIEIAPLNKLKFENLEKTVSKITVTRSMLDRNHHLNNCNYAKLIYDVIDLDKYRIKTFEISFINEAVLNDVIDIREEKIDNFYYIEGYILDKVCFKARVEVLNAL